MKRTKEIYIDSSSEDDFEFINVKKKHSFHDSTQKKICSKSAFVANTTSQIVVHGNDHNLSTINLKEWSGIINDSSSEPWIDVEFPPNQVSIDGKRQQEDNEPSNQETKKQRIPSCNCGSLAMQTIVKSDTNNKGRPYYHCKTRKCRFFCWADGMKRSNSRRMLSWMRFNERFPIVSDFGFNASDLRQGGVGDCWFLSALAVVAERHDLIEKLFVKTIHHKKQCFSIKLFLDGNWNVIVIDNFLPVTEQPRRSELAFDSKLAFSRCGSVEGGQQLWVSLLEKAYAKAHGSYHAISGGEIHEALLDLTGCPTECLSLSDGRYQDIDHLWRLMSEFQQHHLPMGCATSYDPSLKEVGLCGNHAYSILEVKEIQLDLKAQMTMHGQYGDHVRLLRIRNPHGVGEWNGDWSDQSLKWFDCMHQLSRDQKPTGVNDGTFWMDYTSFLQAFAQVDVCYAYQNWHSMSLSNAFPLSQDKQWRLCSTAYLLQPTRGREAAVYISALQPTKRGNWCRTDRKKSYRPGDLSILVLKCSKDTGALLSVVASAFGGCDDRTSVFALLKNSVHRRVGVHNEETVVFVVYLFCLGQLPSAAQQTKEQPFQTRFFSSEPLMVQSFPSSNRAPPPVVFSQSSSSSTRNDNSKENYSSDGIYLNPKRAFLMGWHLSLLQPSETSTAPPTASSTLMSSYIIPQPPFLGRKLLKGNGKNCEVLVIQTRQVLVFMATNRSPTSSKSKESSLSSLSSRNQSYNYDYNAVYKISLKVMVKSHMARDMRGVVTNDQKAADQYYQTHTEPKQSSSGRMKWPAKWKAFVSECVMKPQEQKVLLIIVKSGVQSEIGQIECDIMNFDASSSSNYLSSSSTAQSSIQQYFDKRQKSSSLSSSNELSNGLFESTSIQCPIFHQTQLVNLTSHHESFAGKEDVIEESLIEESIAQSLLDIKSHGDHQSNNQQEEDDLMMAVMASTCEQSGDVICRGGDPEMSAGFVCPVCTFETVMPCALVCDMCGHPKAFSPAPLPVVPSSSSSSSSSLSSSSTYKATTPTSELSREVVVVDSPCVDHDDGGHNARPEPMNDSMKRKACVEARLRRFDL